jgi:hypothetical protein
MSGEPEGIYEKKGTEKFGDTETYIAEGNPMANRNREAVELC